ncbi:hypothetical protein QF048_005312 [Streptomyces sp. W4I9-2]|nr:hypothetical protein [Streptomyces sp. W4I9-2]
MAAPAPAPFRLGVVGRARGVDEGEDGDAEPVRQPDRPGRRAVAGRAGRRSALGDVRDGQPVCAQPEAAQQPRVRGAAPVPVERKPYGEVVGQIGLSAGPQRIAGRRHRLPPGLRKPGRRQCAGQRGGGERVGCVGPGRAGHRVRVGPGHVGHRVRAERAQPVRHRPGQLAGRDDRVHLARRELPLGAVRVRVRVRRPHPGSGEADLRARQCQHHIGARPDRGPAAAGRRVADHRDLREPGRAQPGGGGGHPLELGERDHAFLHPAAAGGDEREQGQPPGQGQLVRSRQPVTRQPSQRAAQETEFEGEQHARAVADDPGSVHHGLLLAGPCPGPLPRRVVTGPAERTVRRQGVRRRAVLGEARRAGEQRDRLPGRRPGGGVSGHGATSS